MALFLETDDRPPIITKKKGYTHVGWLFTHRGPLPRTSGWRIRITTPGKFSRKSNRPRADTALLVFPELCVTGYTCGDLFLQPTLLKGAEEALAFLLTATAALDTVFVVGLPVAVGSVLYNCAAVCQKGRLLGLVPKTNLPAYSEFYEARHFSPGVAPPTDIRYVGQSTRLGADLLFGCRELPAFRFGVEICEDLWVASQPSQQLAAAGALLIANLSASDESIGKGAYRRQLVAAQSARLCCAYLYADAGEGESTSDLVFSGHNLLAENGVMLAESAPFSTGLIAAEIDLERLSYERRRMTTFPQPDIMETILFSYPPRPLTLTRRFPPLPFVPANPQEQTPPAVRKSWPFKPPDWPDGWPIPIPARSLACPAAWIRPWRFW